MLRVLVVLLVRVAVVMPGVLGLLGWLVDDRRLGGVALQTSRLADPSCR